MEKNNMYRFIPMNIDNFNFADLVKEHKENDKLIEWHNGKEEGKNTQDFKVDDVVYIYCTNLTDGTKRLLFRGIVAKVDEKDKYSFDINKKIKSFWIKSIKAIRLNDKETYSYTNLIEKYGMSINQTMQQLATKEDYDIYINNPNAIIKDKNGYTDKEHIEKYKKHLELIKCVEKDLNDVSLHSSLKDAYDYFNNNILCECCKILGLSKKEAHSRTFKKSTGFIYYEVHHLLMKNILYKTNEEWFKENTWYKKETDKDLIEDDFNKIVLCPVCHREFHYGDFNYNGKNKKEVIKELLESKKYEENLRKYGKSNKEIEEIINYIYKQYNVQ